MGGLEFRFLIFFLLFFYFSLKILDPIMITPNSYEHVCKKVLRRDTDVLRSFSALSFPPLVLLSSPLLVRFSKVVLKDCKIIIIIHTGKSNKLWKAIQTIPKPVNVACVGANTTPFFSALLSLHKGFNLLKKCRINIGYGK